MKPLRAKRNKEKEITGEYAINKMTNLWALAFGKVGIETRISPENIYAESSQISEICNSPNY